MLNLQPLPSTTRALVRFAGHDYLVELHPGAVTVFCTKTGKTAVGDLSAVLGPAIQRAVSDLHRALGRIETVNGSAAPLT